MATVDCYLHRSLDYRRNLTVQHRSELDHAALLSLACSDVFFFESSLRSDHFGSLPGLRELRLHFCKLRSLPPRSFVGLSGLQELEVSSHSGAWAAITLDLDYEAFVGLERVRTVRLQDNSIEQLPPRLLCPLAALQTLGRLSKQLNALKF